MRASLGRLLDVLFPPRLGRSFRWLWAASFVNNAGDGVAISAGPLLVASLTSDPFLVSLALLSEFLPALLFGLVSGTVADRVDRKRMVVAVNLGRAAVLAGLVFSIASGTVSIVVVLAALFVLATLENFADAASSTLIPTLVPREHLGLANARMQGTFLLANQLLLPPVGAFLFAAGAAIPFVANAAGFLLGAILISRLAGRMRPAREAVETHFVADMAEGIRWLLHHRPMRTLALTILAFNVTFGAAWGVLVLYAGERLGLGPVGFGLLTTASAIGGIVGAAWYGRLERRLSLGALLRVGLIIETLTHLVLAVTTSAALAMGTLVVFGAHTLVWGTTSTVVRQRSVPNDLLGRVGGVYRIAIVGGMVIGTPIGGLLAREYGITAPFWFAFAGSALLVVLLWREFGHVVVAADPPG